MARQRITRYKRRTGSRYKFKSRTGSVKRSRAYATRRRGRTRTRIPRTINPFPQNKLATHMYADTVIMPAAAVAGGGQIYTFRANGMYDPDKTGTGHQPLYRDEMAAQYSAYTVLKAKISVSFAPTDTTWCYYYVFASTDATPEVVYPNLAQEDYGPSIPLQPNALTNGVITRHATADIAKMRKTTMRGLMADDTFKTLSGSDPGTSAVVHFHIICFPVIATTTLGARSISVRMKQWTMWRDHENPVSS